MFHFYCIRIGARPRNTHKLNSSRLIVFPEAAAATYFLQMAARRRGGRRTRKAGRRYRGRRSGRGGYETSSTRRRRAPTADGGRGIASVLKGIGRFAAKNAPAILKGARYLAGKSGNKTLKSLASSSLLDQGASAISKKFGGRGGGKLKVQARAVVRKLVRRYGEEGARKILRKYMSTRGRGAIGKIIGGILGSIFPF